MANLGVSNASYYADNSISRVNRQVDVSVEKISSNKANVTNGDKTSLVSMDNVLKLDIAATNEEIVIDGERNETIWKTAPIAKDFFRVTPIDTGLATTKTEVQLAYNDEYLFAAIICYDAVLGKRPVESLRRDFSFPKNDNFIK